MISPIKAPSLSESPMIAAESGVMSVLVDTAPIPGSVTSGNNAARLYQKSSCTSSGVERKNHR